MSKHTRQQTQSQHWAQWQQSHWDSHSTQTTLLQHYNTLRPNHHSEATTNPTENTNTETTQNQEMNTNKPHNEQLANNKIIET